MNNLDIDTILISLVVILIVVVIARIAIQRSRLPRQNTNDIDNKNANNTNEPTPQIKEVSQTKENEIGKKDNLDSNKVKEDIIKDSDSDKDKDIDIDNNITLEKEKVDDKETINKEDDNREPITEKEIDDHKKNPIETIISNNKIAVHETKEIDKDLDYQQLITDPISIFSNQKLPSKHRIAAIKEAGYQKMEKAVPELIKALYDPDVSVSLVAAESLGMIGDTRAIDPLLEISKQNDEELYKAAEEYMGGELVIPGEEITFNTYNSKKESELEKDAPLNYKEMVVAKIDQLPLDYFQPDGCPIPRKELVIKGLNDENEQMRQIAVKAAIGIEETEEIVEPLTKALTNTSESEAIRAMAAEALGGMRSNKSTNILLKALTDENVAVRYAAATALSGRSEPKVIEGLIKATRDSNKYVRASAAYALGTSGDELSLRALIKCAEDENEVVRFSAVKAISTYGFDKVYKKLVLEKTGLERKSQILAKIEILSQYKDPRVVDILKGYLNDLDSEITYKASMALMGQENPDVLDELIAASKKLDQELYSLAKENIDPEIFLEITKYNSDFNSGKNLYTNKDNQKSFLEKEIKQTNKNDLLNEEESKKDNTKLSETLSVFGLQKDFSNNIENNEKEDLLSNDNSDEDDDEDLPLEKITGLSLEFEKIRKNLLSNSPNIRAKAAISLGNYKDNNMALELLKAALKDENESVRISAVNSLGKIATMDAFHLIVTCEKDISTEVRYAVVKALSEIQDYSAAEVLKRISLNDISIDVKRNARIALKKYNLI